MAINHLSSNNMWFDEWKMNVAQLKILIIYIE